MAKRYRRRSAPDPEPVVAAESDVLFVPTGSTMLDLVLGGGWAVGRVANVVGDKSSGKTLLAMEALTNFARLYGTDACRYVEPENAFNAEYALRMGMPAEIEPVHEVETVEQFAADLKEFLDAQGSGPCMYVLDSLDALTHDTEMKQEVGAASYGTGKAKLMSELFRKRIPQLTAANCLLLIISQLRDKIGVVFGETKTRAGGHALDFYSSQIVWLAEKRKLTKEVRGIKRVNGVEIVARCRKNKIGMPFRQVDMSILFGYGVDDHLSMLDWAKDNKAPLPPELGSDPKIRSALTRARADQDYDTLDAIQQQLQEAVINHWTAIEDDIAPTVQKYRS